MPRKIYIIDSIGRECTRCKEYKKWELISGKLLDKDGVNYKKATVCKACNRASYLKKQKRIESLPKIEIYDKLCTHCNQVLPISSFGKNKAYRDGYNHYCNPCRREYGRKKSIENHKPSPNNPFLNGKITNDGRECTKCNQFKTWDSYVGKLITKRLHYMGPDWSVNYKQTYICRSCANKENVERAKKKRAYLNEYQNRYRKEKMKTDPVFKLSTGLRSRLNQAFKQRGVHKSKSLEEILGCSVEFLAEHLESKFEPGMSFENHGEWHIDHIIPMATANTEEEVIKLNHYTNLQPLWAKDNLEKRDKLDWKK